jgi:hypothetical protein
MIWTAKLVTASCQATDGDINDPGFRSICTVTFLNLFSVLVHGTPDDNCDETMRHFCKVCGSAIILTHAVDPRDSIMATSVSIIATSVSRMATSNNPVQVQAVVHLLDAGYTLSDPESIVKNLQTTSFESPNHLIIALRLVELLYLHKETKRTSYDQEPKGMSVS